jgi:hypothetical protein
VLFFQEAEKSLEGVCYGVFLYQLWLRLITLHTLWITSRNLIKMMLPLPDEKQGRLFPASEALAYGGIAGRQTGANGGLDNDDDKRIIVPSKMNSFVVGSEKQIIVEAHYRNIKLRLIP